MVRTKENQPITFRNIRGGIGEIEGRCIAADSKELYEKGRLFNHMVIAPGFSVGEHTHSGDNELYYILSGSGLYNDNGTIVEVKQGDTMICNDGEMHGIVNNTDEPLELIALVLYN